jgi:hypothetical protein
MGLRSLPHFPLEGSKGFTPYKIQFSKVKRHFPSEKSVVNQWSLGFTPYWGLRGYPLLGSKGFKGFTPYGNEWSLGFTPYWGLRGLRGLPLIGVYPLKKIEMLLPFLFLAR